MSRIIYILLCALVVHGVHQRRLLRRHGEEEAETIHTTQQDIAVAIVPAPSLMYTMPGSITLPSQVLVKAPAKMLQAFRKHAYEAVSPVAEDETPHVLLELSNTQDTHGDEGYTMQVRKDGVTMKASSEHGLFNAIMTFRQLAKKTDPSSRLSLPLVYIEDKPAFPWRGMMLDVSRHFFPPEDVKHLLDTMAFFKMNHFHWHLTDDQGWRFPVEKYPKLTTVGSMRRETQNGHDQYRTTQGEYNHSYTRDEIDDILQHAESLFIEVMPECDMPGHLESAIAAYPQLGNSDVPDYHPEVEPHFGAFDYPLSPKKQSTKFQNSVLSELVLLFQNSNYVHLGGDEVKPSQWEISASARAISLSENTDADHLEATFVQHAAEHLAKHNRHAVIWDEALSTPNLPNNTVVMLWRNWGSGLEDIGDRAASQQLPVVLAPQSWTYLDQFQSADSSSEPYDANGGLLQLDSVYGMPLQAGKAKVLGMQAQLWSEYISKGRQNMDYMAWPRGAALAEVAWAGSARPGFDDFEKRLTQQLESLDHMEVNYRKLDKRASDATQERKSDRHTITVSKKKKGVILSQIQLDTPQQRAKMMRTSFGPPPHPHQRTKMMKTSFGAAHVLDNLRKWAGEDALDPLRKESMETEEAILNPSSSNAVQSSLTAHHMLEKPVEDD